jgi:hypothetical protein
MGADNGRRKLALKRLLALEKYDQKAFKALAALVIALADKRRVRRS